jgi:hypothetical protein
VPLQIENLLLPSTTAFLIARSQEPPYSAQQRMAVNSLLEPS